MSSLLKNIIKNSAKKQSVSFKNKEKRTTFDESFGKDKIQLINKIIGSNENFIKLNEKLKSI
jgi:hypothetical protein